MSTGTEARQRRTSTDRAPRTAVPAHLPANILARIARLTDSAAGPAAHWRWLGSKMQANGYPQISYRDPETGKRVTRNVHRVLMEIGTGRRLDRAEVVLHAAGCRQDDVNPSRLRIGTHRENLIEARAKCGKRLPAAHVLLIDKMLRRGLSASTIAARFGVSPKCVVDILRGKTHASATGRERTTGKGGRPRKRVLIASASPAPVQLSNITLPPLAALPPAAGEIHTGSPS